MHVLFRRYHRISENYSEYLKVLQSLYLFTEASKHTLFRDFQAKYFFTEA
jgi:hypothetical protein